MLLVSQLIGPSAEAQKTAKGPKYQIVDLGSLAGAVPGGTYANAINRRGEVVGGDYFSFSDGEIFAPVAFQYKDGRIEEVGSLGGYVSDAEGINEEGWIVGSATIASDPFNTRHAFLYDGTMIDLGTLGGSTSDALGINNKGEVVGSAQEADGTYEAFVFSGGTLLGLGSLPGMDSSQANGINERGHIVGVAWSSSGNNATAGFFYDGSMQDLGSLGGSQTGAQAINRRDVIVGGSQLADGTSHAFLYDGTMHDLGALEGGTTVALAINNKNQVVGDWNLPGPSEVLGAFLYEDGDMYDLLSLVKGGKDWSYFIEATGINESGQIVGSGVKADGVHAFRLDPVE